MAYEIMNGEKMRIIGYGDPLGVRSAPLNTILENSKDQFFVLWSNGTINELDMTGFDANKEGHIKETEGKYVTIEQGIKNELYSYMDNEGEIHTKHPKEMLEIMRKDIRQLKEAGEEDDILSMHIKEMMKNLAKS